MFKFKSLARAQTWYEIDCHNYSLDSGTCTFFADYWFEFSDYGDNGVKHSPSHSVHLDNAADAMASAARFLFDNPAALENECIPIFFPEMPRAERVHFLEKLRLIDGKTRYYSLELLKVTSNDEKRHDKRFQQVDSHCNGSIDFIVRHFNDPATVLKGIAYTVYVSELLDVSCPIPFSKMKYDVWSGLRDAFNALRRVIESTRARQHAQSAIDCLMHNLELRAEKTESAAA